MKQPESQPALPVGHEVPRGATLLCVASSYKDLAKAISCGLPHCHVKHKKGFVVDFQTVDGQLGQGMVGHICGSNHFGEVDWTRHMKEHLVRENLTSLTTKVNLLIEDCEDLLPQLEPLVGIASVVDRSRHTLESKAKELYWICEDASRRNRSLISYHEDQKMELRLRHRGFWTRLDVMPRLLRLKQDLLDFKRVANAAASAQRLSEIITKLGLPYDRARSLAADLSESLQTLSAENIAEILPFVNWMTRSQAMRMNGSVLEVCDPAWRGNWTEVLNLEFFQRHVKRLAKVQEAVMQRDVA